MKLAATARAGFVLDIDDLFDPLEVSWQRAAINPARLSDRSMTCFVPGMLGLGKSGLDFLQSQLELIGIELLGPTAKTMALQGGNNRLQAFNLGLKPLQRVEFAGLCEDKRPQRFDIVRKVRLDEHGGSESVREIPVNRRFVER